MIVEKGNTIKVEYTGSFENGEIFDASKSHGQPLEFKAGEGMVVPGFDNAVLGMELNEEKTITLQPKDAYGMPNPQAIQIIPKTNFPTGAKEGMIIGVPLPDGKQIPARITKITDTQVTIDMNPPMAGKVLIFKIKIVKIN